MYRMLVPGSRAGIAGGCSPAVLHAGEALTQHRATAGAPCDGCLDDEPDCYLSGRRRPAAAMPGAASGVAWRGMGIDNYMIILMLFCS